MIKLLFFIESLEHGGAEKSLVSLLQHLDYTIYKVDLLLMKKEGAIKNQVPKDVRITYLNTDFGIISKFKFRFFKIFLAKRHNAQFFWKAFKDDLEVSFVDYDVAIGWGQGFATYYVAEKIKAKKKVAWINTNYDQAGYVFDFDKYLYDIYDKVNGVSPFAVEVMSKHVASNKLIQITNIIAEEDVIAKSKLQCPTTFNSDIFNIVSVGRLAKPKGFELAVQAANILQNMKVNFHWYIVGDGSERPTLEKSRKDLDLVDKVTFIGFDTNPYSYIAQADLYVQTSHFEGLGRTLIEAAILHKPIVTTDFDTAFSLVIQNKTGLITSKKPLEIARAIHKLYSEESMYSDMVNNLQLNSRISSADIISEFDIMVSNLFQGI